MSIYRPYTLCVTFWHCSGPEQWNFFCSGPEWCWSVIYLGVLRLYLNRCKSTHHGCSYKGVLSVNLFYGSVGCGFRLSIAVVIPLSSHSHTHTHTHTHTYKKKITQFMQPCWVLLQHISTIIIFNYYKCIFCFIN